MPFWDQAVVDLVRPLWSGDVVHEVSPLSTVPVDPHWVPREDYECSERVGPRLLLLLL